jgi:hypothetical protein
VAPRMCGRSGGRQRKVHPPLLGLEEVYAVRKSAPQVLKAVDKIMHVLFASFCLCFRKLELFLCFSPCGCVCVCVCVFGG